MFEEILIGHNPQPTQHPRILKALEEFIPWDQLQQQLHSLNSALRVNDVHAIRSLLQRTVTGYQPSDELVDWVYLGRGRQAAES